MITGLTVSLELAGLSGLFSQILASYRWMMRSSTSSLMNPAPSIAVSICIDRRLPTRAAAAMDDIFGAGSA